MTSCEKTLAVIVNEVLNLISEEYMRTTIEAPLEAAAAKFDVRGKCPPGIAYGEFAGVVGGFVSLVYREGLPCPMPLNRDMACAEAVFILERTYRGSCTDGFVGAFLDARAHGDGGLEGVLSHMLGIIENTQKERHMEAVITDKVRFLPWETRKDLAAFLLDHGGFENEHLHRCAPWQLADLCSEMIMICSKSFRTWRDFLASRPARSVGAAPEYSEI